MGQASPFTDPPARPDNFLAEQGAPHADEIRQQLGRIVKSAAFRDSLRLTRFLTFVVEATLAGKGDRIKAYTIAVEALGRGGDFDSQADPIVRVEAGRLRQALARYYSGAGAHDPLVIDVPRGGYVPIFRPRDGKDAVPLHSPAPADREGGLLNDALLRLVDLCQMIPNLVDPARGVAERPPSDSEPATTSGWHVDAARLLGAPSADPEREPAAAVEPLTPMDADARSATALRLIAMLDALEVRLRGATNLRSAAETILDGIVQLHKTDCGSVQLYDEPSRELIMVAQRGFRADLLRPFSRIDASSDQYLSSRAAASRAPVVIGDAFAAGQYPFLGASAAAVGYRALQATPMITSDGRLVGVMATHFARFDDFARLDMQMTQFYARLAANALVKLLPPPGHRISLEPSNRAA